MKFTEKNVGVHSLTQVTAVLLLSAMVLSLGFVAPLSAHAQGAGTAGNTTAGSAGQGGSDSTGGNPDAGSGGNPDAGSGGSGGSDNSGGNPDAGNGGGETLIGNNMSFPTIAADGYGIAVVNEELLTSPYEGSHTGLSAEQLALLEGSTWYAQKTEGNVWQSEFDTAPVDESVAIYGVDWGDLVEAVNPIIGNPFRLEFTLYQQQEEEMLGYEMELLANPSSLDEIQGTNGKQYESDFATVVSSKPELTVQYLGEAVGTGLSWTGEQWTRNGVTLPSTNLSFGPELNVGGKYIYGTSKGGWRPVNAGFYRVTFSMQDSAISLEDAVVGNYADWTATEEAEESEESRATQPVIDAANNLSYADILVVTQREGTPPENPGEEEESADSAVITDITELSASTAADVCEPYLTDYLAMGTDNDPDEVVLLQSFLNKELNMSIPTTGYFGPITRDAVKVFQGKYADKILKPWVDAGYSDVSVTEGTGVVYYTTLPVINEIQCN